MKNKLSMLVAAMSLSVVPMLFAADIAKLTESCTHCHGKDGASTDTHVPIIGGQPKTYIANSLKGFKAKERVCPEMAIPTGPQKDTKTDMCKIADALSDDDVAQLAAFYAGKKFVRSAQNSADAGLAAKGKEIHKQSCEKCHTDGGTTSAEDSTIVAGQQMGYLSNSFKEMLSEKRTIDKKMKVKFDDLNRESIDALIHYYGSQK